METESGAYAQLLDFLGPVCFGLDEHPQKNIAAIQSAVAMEIFLNGCLKPESINW